MTKVARSAAVTMLVLVGPTAVTAQRHKIDVSVSPFVAGFIPTQDLGEIRLPLTAGGPTTTQAQMTTDVAFGGRITLTGRGRLGLEGTFFSTGADLRTTRGIPVTFKARTQAGTVKITYQATSENSGTDLVLGGGVVGIDHSGPAFALTTGSQFDIGGVAAGGLHIMMSSMVSIRFDAELHVYPWTAGPEFRGLTQSDLVVGLGFGLKLGH